MADNSKKYTLMLRLKNKNKNKNRDLQMLFYCKIEKKSLNSLLLHTYTHRFINNILSFFFYSQIFNQSKGFHIFYPQSKQTNKKK